jgi:hypothetical protein
MSSHESRGFFSLAKNGGPKGRRSREGSLPSSRGPGSVASLDDAIPDYQLFEGSVWPTTSLEESLPDLLSESLDGERESHGVSLSSSHTSSALKKSLNRRRLSVSIPPHTQEGTISEAKRSDSIRRYSVAPEEIAASHPVASRRASFSLDPSTAAGLGASRRSSFSDLTGVLSLSPSNANFPAGPGMASRPSLSPLSPSVTRHPTVIREGSNSVENIRPIAVSEIPIQKIIPSGNQDKEYQSLGALKDAERTECAKILHNLLTTHSSRMNSPTTPVASISK